MTLYEINEALAEVLARMVDPETGEVTDDALAEIQALAGAREDKLENVALYHKNLLAEAEAIKAEEAKLAARRKSKESHADRLKTYLADSMAGETLDTPRVRISWRKSSPVILTADAEKFIEWAKTAGHFDELVRVKHEEAPALAEIKKFINAGGGDGIPAVVSEGANIQIK